MTKWRENACMDSEPKDNLVLEASSLQSQDQQEEHCLYKLQLLLMG